MTTELSNAEDIDIAVKNTIGW